MHERTAQSLAAALEPLAVQLHVLLGFGQPPVDHPAQPRQRAPKRPPRVVDLWPQPLAKLLAAVFSTAAR